MASIHTQYNITNKETGQSFVLNDHVTDPNNFLALQSFPTFALDMRAGDIPFTGHHGAYKLPHFYGGRSIIFSGLIVGEDEASVWTQKKLIDEVLQLGSGAEYNELLTISYTDPNGLNISMDATLNASVSYSRSLKEPNILNFQILLRSRKPYMLIDDDVFDLTIYTGSLGGVVSLFRLPFTIPFQLNNTTTNILDITADNKVKTVITLYGSADDDIVNPSIENISTGKSTVFDYTIPKGASNFIRIDGLTGDVIDQDGNNIAIYIKNGGFIELRKGLNRFSYTADENEDGSLPTALFKITGKQFII